jgi:hypothetical protein
MALLAFENLITKSNGQFGQQAASLINQL